MVGAIVLALPNSVGCQCLVWIPSKDMLWEEDTLYNMIRTSGRLLSQHAWAYCLLGDLSVSYFGSCRFFPVSMHMNTWSKTYDNNLCVILLMPIDKIWRFHVCFPCFMWFAKLCLQLLCLSPVVLTCTHGSNVMISLCYWLLLSVAGCSTHHSSFAVDDMSCCAISSDVKWVMLAQHPFWTSWHASYILDMNQLECFACTDRTLLKTASTTLWSYRMPWIWRMSI